MLGHLVRAALAGCGLIIFLFAEPVPLWSQTYLPVGIRQPFLQSKPSAAPNRVPGQGAVDGTPDIVPTSLGLVDSTDRWDLTFHDEFDCPVLDETKWSPHFSWGRSNETELEYYADDSHEIFNGVLRLRAERRAMEGRDYTSGLIASQDKFAQEFGYFEVRCRTPRGTGLWSTFFLLPDAGGQKVWPPEIDVVENRGYEPNTIHLTNHYKTEETEHAQTGKQYVGPDFAQDFHVFAVDWRPDRVSWIIDGVEQFRLRKNVPSGKMFVVANLAIGGWAHLPDSSTAFPSYFDIDYIRVFRRVP